MTVVVKFQIEIRCFIELHGNSKLSMASCLPSSGSILTKISVTPVWFFFLMAKVLYDIAFTVHICHVVYRGNGPI